MVHGRRLPSEDVAVRLADSLDAEDGAAAASSIELADRLGRSEAAAPTLARGGRRAAVRAVMENFPPSPRVVPSLLLARGRRRGQNVRVSPVMRVAVSGPPRGAQVPADRAVAGGHVGGVADDH